MQTNKIKKHVLFVGLFDKDTKAQKIGSLAARDILQNILLSSGLDGATLSDAVGIYKHENGTFVIEPSIRIEILFSTDSQIRKICDQIKIALNQESVAVETQITDSRLY